MYIKKTYGGVGDKPVENKKFVKSVKSQENLFQQAIFIANSDWNKMKDKKGYVTDQQLLKNTTTQLMGNTKQNKIPLQFKSQETTQNNSETESQLGIVDQNNLQSDITSDNVEKMRIKTDHDKMKLKLKCKTATDSSNTITNYPLTRQVNDDKCAIFKFLPMLANKFTERKAYVKYPCFVQPKIDGVRFTARKLDGEIIIKSRNNVSNKLFYEIRDAVAQLNLENEVLLDGEFYSKKIPFNILNGYCNRKTLDSYSKIPKQHLESIHYYIFDCYFIDQPLKVFSERYEYLQELMTNNQNQYIQLVPCEKIHTEADIKEKHDQYVQAGNEGLIIRNINGPYKLKDRSNDLLKYKEYEDREYLIVGAECPQTGKDEGCIIWKLMVPETQKTFTCRPRDSTIESRKMDWLEFESNPNQFIGQLYTVRLQGTYENGIPRFPVGIAIRYDL